MQLFTVSRSTLSKTVLTAACNLSWYSLFFIVSSVGVRSFPHIVLPSLTLVALHAHHIMQVMLCQYPRGNFLHFFSTVPWWPDGLPLIARRRVPGHKQQRTVRGGRQKNCRAHLLVVGCADAPIVQYAVECPDEKNGVRVGGGLPASLTRPLGGCPLRPPGARGHALECTIGNALPLMTHNTLHDIHDTARWYVHDTTRCYVSSHYQTPFDKPCLIIALFRLFQRQSNTVWK